MEIDFHHTVTYVVARLAGLDRADAGTVAHCAQYVDDAAATNPFQAQPDTLRPCIGGLVGHPVAILFHVLPGNGGLPAGENPSANFVDKTVCRADSPPARAMIAGAIADRNRSEGLHRLGLALHVYADSWAHHGFAGVHDPVNQVSEHTEIGDCGVFPEGLSAAFERLKVTPCLPFGHRQASRFPDLPFLAWRYVNGKREPVERHSPAFFGDAANCLFMALRRFIAGDAEAPVEGLDGGRRRAIVGLLGGIRHIDKKLRHQHWLNAIRDDAFGFGAESLSYGKDDGDDAPYAKAVAAHVSHMTEEVLPGYGIRVEF